MSHSLAASPPLPSRLLGATQPQKIDTEIADGGGETEGDFNLSITIPECCAKQQWQATSARDNQINAPKGRPSLGHYRNRYTEEMRRKGEARRVTWESKEGEGGGGRV